MHNAPGGMANTIFHAINSVAIAVVIASLLWTASTLTELNTKVAVLISQNEAKESEHARIYRRITDLERNGRNQSGNTDRNQ